MSEQSDDWNVTASSFSEFIRKVFKDRSGIADAGAVFAVFLDDEGKPFMDVAVTPPERTKEMFNAIYAFLTDLKERTGW